MKKLLLLSLIPFSTYSMHLARLATVARSRQPVRTVSIPSSYTSATPRVAPRLPLARAFCSSVFAQLKSPTELNRGNNEHLQPMEAPQRVLNMEKSLRNQQKELLQEIASAQIAQKEKDARNLKNRFDSVRDDLININKRIELYRMPYNELFYLNMQTRLQEKESCTKLRYTQSLIPITVGMLIGAFCVPTSFLCPILFSSSFCTSLVGLTLMENYEKIYSYHNRQKLLYEHILAHKQQVILSNNLPLINPYWEAHEKKLEEIEKMDE